MKTAQFLTTLLLALVATVLLADPAMALSASAPSLDGGSLAQIAIALGVGLTLTATQLRSSRAEKIDEARAILDKAEKEDRDLTEDEQTRWDGLVAEADKLEEDAERQERQAELDKSLDKRNAPKTVETGDVDTPDPSVNEDTGVHWRRRTVRYFGALAMGKEDAQRSASMMREVLKEAREMPAAQIKDEEKEALAVIKRSGLADDRQTNLRALLQIGEFRLLTSAEGDAQGGDNLLPKPFLAELFVLTEQYGVARDIFRVVPFTGAGNTMDLKNIASRVLAYWVDQGELIPPSDMTFGPGQLKLNKLAGITSWTTEAQEDTAFNLIPIIQQDFAEAISFKEDQAGLVGDGTATSGGFTGVLNLAGATATNTATANGVVTEANLRKVKQSVTMSRRGTACWLMHESVMENIRQLENGAGYRLFAETPAQAGGMTLLGYPVKFAEVLPSASGIAGNAKPILAFGDFKRVLMGVKRGMTADISTTAILQNSTNGDVIYNAYQADGALLRVTERVGFAIPSSVAGAIAVLKSVAA